MSDVSGARRGDRLREHILWTAKDVFLEMGFERASMDEIASRAGTSKRSLYAHFASKENLFLAFLELMRGLVLGRVKTPAEYSEEPAEALTLFCSRFLELLLYEGAIRLCRVVISEAERFPEGAALYFDVTFSAVQERMAAYLEKTFGLSPAAGAEAAERLIGQVLYPRFPRALFGVDPLREIPDFDPASGDFHTAPIRRAVADLLETLERQ